ncbi:MAG: flippase-like domain-containing protein [Caldilineaceae bacterium]|nr:flippase-like domain-containing protein [Caldilineaceae bacterium]
MKKPSIRAIEVVFGLLLLILLYFTFRDLSLANVWAVLKRMDPLQVMGLLVLNGGIALLLASRWWIILRGLGQHIPYGRVAEFRLIGATVSQLTPGPQFGGEPTQVHLLVQDGVPLPKAIASVTLEKTLELFTNFGFLILGTLFILSQGIFGPLLGWTAPLLTLLLLFIPSGVLILLWRGGHPISRGLARVGTVLPSTWQKWMHLWLISAINSAEEEIYHLIRRRPLALIAALGASTINWLIVMGEYWLVTQILHMNLSFVEVIALLVAARLAFLLPMPGGLGTLEASQVFTLILLGQDPAVGIGLSLLMRTRDLALIVAGIYLAWRNGWFRRPRAQTQRSDLKIGD